MSKGVFTPLESLRRKNPKNQRRLAIRIYPNQSDLQDLLSLRDVEGGEDGEVRVGVSVGGYRMSFE